MKHFMESLNTAVFTTRFVFKDKRPILYVSHEIEDGAWQFLSDDDFENYEDVAMLVSLEEIIDLDISILEISDMPLGYKASRKTKADKWIIKESSQE